MKIRVCVPSYRRPEVLTLRYLPFAAVYVDKSEEGVYRACNPGAEIIACPEGIQGNLCRVRNYIMRSEFANGADVVAILDDDYSGLFYWEGGEEHKVSSDEFIPFLARYSLLAREWGARFWGVNVNYDRQCYRENTPFSTISYIGGPFQVFLRGNECFYDEALPLKEDYDMTLQQLRRHRIALRLNKYFYRVKQSEQVGGCATYRNLDKEREQLETLRRKWGARIVRFDFSDRSHKGVKSRNAVFIDYNPVIKSPIRGV